MLLKLYVPGTMLWRSETCEATEKLQGHSTKVEYTATATNGTCHDRNAQDEEAGYRNTESSSGGVKTKPLDALASKGLIYENKILLSTCMCAEGAIPLSAQLTLFFGLIASFF